MLRTPLFGPVAEYPFRPFSPKCDCDSVKNTHGSPATTPFFHLRLARTLGKLARKAIRQQTIFAVAIAGFVALASASVFAQGAPPATADGAAGEVAVTLMSSFGSQSIAAGTDSVLMSRYRVEVGLVDAPLSLVSFPLAFEGAAGGLSGCLLEDGDDFRHLIDIEAGPTSADLEVPYVFAPNTGYDFTLFCDIASDAVGQTYRWGIAPVAVFTGADGETFSVTTELARQWNGRPGLNGQTFIVTFPERLLNAASFAEVRIVGEEGRFAPGDTLAVSVMVRNDGAETWEAGNYVLIPDSHNDTALWGVTPVSLGERVVPGGTASVVVSLVAPNDVRTHRLSWYVAVLDDRQGELLQQPATLALVVELSRNEVSATTGSENGFFERLREGASRTIQAVTGVGGGGGGAPATRQVQTSSGPADGPEHEPAPQVSSNEDDPTEAVPPPEAAGTPRMIVEYCEEVPDATDYCDL
ncbi:MAG: hypothetical protein COV10_01325 [Candidatus Vogelbacteria bacterium CG10_big_fil_rev_8_21_14_0_10_51_16]|uniref:Uncharacterized protein n=1 Tax=Candidatus Vogelbacteria bacterium CG10_big_fil_rev_8_21_14_0_10_51_16 TaxID=1975045 RepID=A0A2H0RFA9_9BACT|nr:MAG: hypothetical protein COV10_01325 [Candidatus Vogelbacteria bacterium CG10_big_fil_rev_8_21_14_0_10_51_16]